MITEQDNLSPEEGMESLRRAALFKGLPDEELRALAGIVKRIKAEPGDLLFEEGDEDDRFYVVTAGAVEIVKHVPGGGEEKLAVRRAGHAFGEMALLNSAPRFATARVARECECMTLSREDFERLMVGGRSMPYRGCRLGPPEKLWKRCSKPSGGRKGPTRITRQYSSYAGTDGIIYSRFSSLHRRIA